MLIYNLLELKQVWAPTIESPRLRFLKTHQMKSVHKRLEEDLCTEVELIPRAFRGLHSLWMCQQCVLLNSNAAHCMSSVMTKKYPR